MASRRIPWMGITIVVILFAIIVYLLSQQVERAPPSVTNCNVNVGSAFEEGGSRGNLRFPLNDPYVPPLKPDFWRGMLPPVATQGPAPPFSQMGLLTHGTKQDLILPLMGRPLMVRRDRFQYYAISNTGTLNTKLPIRVRGQNGLDEYGCQELYSGDHVWVQGYNEEFKVTLYETAGLTYL